MKHHHHHDHDWRRHWAGPQVRRGDIGPLILGVLTERPMHGYEVIKALEDKSHGLWRPSPGSVYPTLQLLEEQDFVTSSDDHGKRVYTITEAGRKEERERAAEAPWEKHGEGTEQMIDLRQTLGEMARTMHAIVRSGSDDHMKQAVAILEEAQGKLQELA